MTTAIGIQLDDGAIVVVDSRITADGKIYTDPRMTKIIQKGNYIIAGAGDLRAIQVALHVWNPPTPTVKDKTDLYAFVIAKVVPSLRQCLDDNKIALDSDKEGKESPMDLALIVAVCGKLFEIDGQFTVTVQAHGIYAIGSGSDFATGALRAGAEPQRAMEIAEESDSGTSAPFKTFEQYI